MCRNIKRLRRPDDIPTDAELHDAALQFIRKISGYRVPSQVNKEAFESAVDGVVGVTRTMFRSLHVAPSRPSAAAAPAHHHHHPHSHKVHP